MLTSTKGTASAASTRVNDYQASICTVTQQFLRSYSTKVAGMVISIIQAVWSVCTMIQGIDS